MSQYALECSEPVARKVLRPSRFLGGPVTDHQRDLLRLWPCLCGPGGGYRTARGDIRRRAQRSPEVRVGFQFDTLHSVEGRRGMRRHMELVKGDAGVGQVR